MKNLNSHQDSILLLKILLFSVLAVAMIGLMVPSAFGEIDVKYEWKETWEKLDYISPSMLQGIVIDSNDHIYVIDSNRLIKMTKDNQILWDAVYDITPSGELFLNQNDEILLPFSHKGTYELRKYSPSGELLKAWNLNDFENSFEDSFVYVDKNENIYLNQFTVNTQDSTNIVGIVKKFDSTGKSLKVFENMGLLMRVDKDENLYTTEPGKIVKYDNNGMKISEYGKQEYRGGPGTFFQTAENILVDSNGMIFATAGQYGPINIFDMEGNSSAIGGYGIGEKSYGWPRGIAMDSEQTIYVTDYSRNKILLFELKIDTLLITKPSKPVLSFVDPEKDPSHYVKRYLNESTYKDWFDENFPNYTLYEGIGISHDEYMQIVDKLTNLESAPEPQPVTEPEPEPKMIENEKTEIEFVDLKKFIPKNYHFIETDYHQDDLEKYVAGMLTDGVKEPLKREDILFTISIQHIIDKNRLWDNFKFNKGYVKYPENINVSSATCYKGWIDEKLQRVSCVIDDEFIVSIRGENDNVKVMQEIIDNINKNSVVEMFENVNEEGGGCLIATAAYGSELAPQVQFLRELRDNTVLQTTSGTAFMNTFNQFYYSFSPYVADYERENPVFKEAVKVSLTPLLTSLTLLNYVEIDTEEEMLGYGISIILLNIGMYFVAPAVLIIALKKRLDSFRGQ